MNGPAELPDNYPSQWIESVVLRDGTAVLLRPIRPDDAPRLQEGFNRLSPQTIYLRFLEAQKELTDADAHAYTNLDYRERMAFVAVIQVEGADYLVGVARYAMLGRHEPGIAEAAIVVGDEYQGRGLGGLMLEKLTRYGQAHGVQGFMAAFHMGNARIMKMIARSGLSYDRQMLEPGVWRVNIWLNPAEAAG